MMQNHKISVALFLALSSVYLQTAVAETATKTEAAKPPKTAHQPSLAGKASFIAEFDQDGDGEVRQAEFKQVRQQRYQQMDQHKNQQVTAIDYQTEYADRLDRKLKQERDGQIQQTHTRVKALDKDLDGAISLAEYQASGERAFTFLDTNKDAEINQQDPAPAARSERPAANASMVNSTATKPEQATARATVRPNSVLKMPTSHNLAGLLEMYDQNQDGTVSKEEYLAQRQTAFNRTDGNGDGTLSADEYLNEFVDRLDRQVASVRTSQLKQALVRFKALDKDEDSYLSQAEYDASGARMFKRWDTSDDTLVTMSEALPKAETATSPNANAGTADAPNSTAAGENSVATGQANAATSGKSTQDVTVKTN
jgi:Ca2+-binding EF-hand superfamily protein